MKKLRSKKGITIVALVVTLIVILILVGVTLNVTLNENGIIAKTRETKTSQEETADMEAIRSAVQGFLTRAGTVNFTAFQNNYSGDNTVNGYTIAYNSNYNYATADNGETTRFYVDEYGNVTKGLTEEKLLTFKYSSKSPKITIPEGFGIINTTGETENLIQTLREYEDYLEGSNAENINNGLVIQDGRENQFVWIPVNNPSEMYGIDSNGNKLGKLYLTFTGENDTPLNWSEDPTTKVMSWGSQPSKEPKVNQSAVTEGQYGNDAIYSHIRQALTDNELKGITEESSNEDIVEHFKSIIQTDFNSMVDSVVIYGGFYVGRYETSTDNRILAKVVAGSRRDKFY